MFQVILAVIIVIIAISVAIYRIVKYLKNPLHECDGCDLSCGGCSLEDLKKEMESKRK